jgi:hypothetical protein
MSGNGALFGHRVLEESGLERALKLMTSVLMERPCGDREAQQGRRLGEDGGRGWSDEATSKQCWKPPEMRERQGTEPPVGPQKEATLAMFFWASE